LSTKVDPNSALMFYCPECGQPMMRSPNEFLAEPEVACPGCGINFKPNIKELIERRQNLFDRFAALKKQIARQGKDSD
jgi:predicted RNA-binding Zn-ribbon protein involved in translation (DUF1610 family)